MLIIDTKKLKMSRISKENKRWLEKKKRKHNLWEVKSFLKSLRIRYKEQHLDTPDYAIVVPLFGIKFRFGGEAAASDEGWKVFYIDKKKLIKEPAYFREDVIWYLIERGYMSYLRDINKRLFATIIDQQGWGLRIIKKRLEFYKDKPEYTFRRIKNEEMYKFPMPRIISSFSGFFDFLY